MNHNQQHDLLVAMQEQQRACQRYMPDLNGISHGEFHTLQLIEFLLQEVAQESPPPPGVKASLLSIHSKVSKPAISQMLKSLEKKQLIDRIACAHDRRVVYVRLTECGHRIITDSQKFFYEFLGKITEQLGMEDTQELIRLLRRTTQIILSLDWNPVRTNHSLSAPRKGGSAQ